jgi:NhaP-type Na+/H+ or K+/H+ antiporter
VLSDHLSWTVAAYAVLSLTVVRMVPVALASIGAGLDRWTVLFIGWFGPRGLASLVFGLIALEELDTAADEAIAVITTTVLLSVVLHGLTAAVLAQKYGDHEAARAPAA